ncbi:tetratricopeptide repeat protein [Phytoactinopolyspora alkaliphila]|nr:tetratricopeptide repeat protein [Phytoactinopolyspora alkaliphila]
MRALGHPDTPRPPSPVGAESLDDLVNMLRELREWAGAPSYALIAQRIKQHREQRGMHPGRRQVSRATVYDCFRLGRARIDVELLTEIVQALGVPPTEAVAWRQAHATAMGSASTASVVEIHQSIPPPSTVFAGRQAELDGLSARPLGSTLAVVGMAGIGKTELTLQLTARLTRQHSYTGGSYFVDLRGYDASRQPADPYAVLRGLLTAVGQPAGKVNRLSVDQQLSEWSAWARDRSFLLILDNATDENQVRPLLPRRHRGHVIVTSRRRLADLAHVPQTELQPLALDDALELLTQAAVAARVTDDPTSAARLAELCAGHPLDLTIVAAHLGQHPAWSLEDQVRRLESTPRGESIRPALAVSYRALNPDEQRALRLLSLYPGPSISAEAATSLLDRDPEEAAKLLATLDAEHLVRHDERGGVRLHDLVREYATWVTRHEESFTEQRAAVRRLIEYYVRGCAYAFQQVTPAEDHAPRLPADHAHRVPTEAVSDPRAWLDAGHQPAVVAATVAMEYGLSAPVAELSAVLALYLAEDGHLAQGEILHRLATTVEDPQHRARAHRDLSLVHQTQGRHSDAIRQLELATAAGPDPLPGRTHNIIGGIYNELGRLDDAVRHFVLAEDEARAANDDVRVARSKNNQANAYRHLWRLEEAEKLFAEVVEASARLGDTLNLQAAYYNRAVMFEAMGRCDEALHDVDAVVAIAGQHPFRGILPASHNIRGLIYQRLGRYDEAHSHHQRALETAVDLDDASTVGESLTGLGRALAGAGRLDESITYFERAIAHAREFDAPYNEGNALNGLGSVLRRQGLVDDAKALHTQARELGERFGDVEEIARSHVGLGHCASAYGDRRRAVHHWELALARYGEMKAPEAEAVRRLIAQPRPAPIGLRTRHTRR